MAFWRRVQCQGVDGRILGYGGVIGVAHPASTCCLALHLATHLQDIATFLGEHSAEQSEEERNAISEAVSIATNSR